MANAKNVRKIRERGSDTPDPPDALEAQEEQGESREDLDWTPEGLKRALEGIWKVAAKALREGSKKRQ
ncbi:MAG: hypothetical protein A3K65_00675 [Euryarchaeota archaeon RBG_16_68_12]|nr:MAG: hypothetical protein A3K65_00675 [Euryarchaeota archaeon RBG_16_68_12]